MQTTPLMSTKNCHQLANYWGMGTDRPIKLLGGTCPRAPLKFTPMHNCCRISHTVNRAVRYQSQQRNTHRHMRCTTPRWKLYSCRALIADTVQVLIETCWWSCGQPCLPLREQSSERQNADGAECTAAQCTQWRPRTAVTQLRAIPVENHQTFLYDRQTQRYHCS